MSRDTLEHIFEPFFTTKEVGQGTGLGLATVYGIVKQSSGFVWAYSEPGRGTAFRIYLPALDAATSSDTAPTDGAAGRHTEVILVAEDEPTVRAIVARSLREFGYTVLEAGDGVEALELAERQPTAPDLVIADVVMPGLSGRDLARRLVRRWPGLPVLFTSGYTGTDAIGRGLLDSGEAFIQKPLAPDALARKVRQMLDDSTTRSVRK
jgi:CheY-like chemotaxis protein